MSQPPRDTSAAVDAMMVDAYRRMTPTEKLQRVGELNHALWQLAAADVRQRHPQADEREVRLRVASRWIPPELMLAAFGWDVAEQGY